jgi:hypothetical protein
MSQTENASETAPYFDMSSNFTVNDNEENWKHWAMKRCKILTL